MRRVLGTIAAASAIALTIAPPAMGGGVVATRVRTTQTSAWATPSPDPAGLTYRKSLKKLLVSDPEVDETTLFVNKNIFEAIKEGDRLLHHPYDSYDGVTEFINQAVDDEDVVAIKICLYRTGPESPIPPALIRAAEQGKQVTALIELKARFDEEHNIEWAQKLDQAGVHVVYGVLGLKTHGKLTLVIRREGDELKRYVHVASGNYNPTTSCTYTDLGMFTVDDEIGRDATELFN